MYSNGLALLILGIVLLILPFILTIKNIVYIFIKESKITDKKRKRMLINDMLIMLLGLTLTVALY